MTLPLFITKASLELMLLASFLLFLIAIVTVGTLRRTELESTGWMRYANGAFFFPRYLGSSHFFWVKQQHAGPGLELADQ